LTFTADPSRFVCALDGNTKDIVHIRDYGSSVQARVWQAALATSAAKSFFDSCTIGNRTFFDGGTGANNPVREVEYEAIDIWCGSRGAGDLKELVKCFISIGTGYPRDEPVKDGAVEFLTDTLVSIATETENTAKKFISSWAGHFDKNRYFRFNVEQGLQEIELHEYQKLGVMESTAERYLDYVERKRMMQDCTENLVQKQSVYAYDFS
jgi:predicted acylesterase/phospholipase RssA